jgi:site-specific recombinase XerD
MEKYIQEYIQYLRVERRCSIKTLESYKNDIEQFVKEETIKELSDITKIKIRSLLFKLDAPKEEGGYGMEATSRNRKLTAIRSFCKYLLSEGYIEKNPAIDIKFATVDRKLPSTISVQQTVSIIESAETLRDKAALEIMYGTGCRVAELVIIKYSDFDLEGQRLRLFGKGRKERIVPLGGPAVEAIREYIASNESDSVYLFPSPKDSTKPITTRAMYNVTRKYGDANGIAISPHKFRHSYATHLLSNNADIRSIQKLLGHVNINTTTVYTQVAIDKLASEFHQAHPRG